MIPLCPHSHWSNRETSVLASAVVNTYVFLTANLIFLETQVIFSKVAPCAKFDMWPTVRMARLIENDKSTDKGQRKAANKTRPRRASRGEAALPYELKLVLYN